MIFLGYFAGQAGYLGEAGIRGLGAFVFNLAIPPYVFRLMAGTDLDAITEWGFLGGYLAAQIVVFATGAAIGRLVFGMAIAEMTIQAFGSAFSNGVMLGLPLLLWLYGDAGGVPALLIITLDVIVFSSVTVLLEVGRGGTRGATRGRIVPQAARSVVVNPIIMGTVLGILYGLSGLALPAVVDKTVAFIGQAAAPSALFALGATWSLRRIAGQPRPRRRHDPLQAAPAPGARLPGVRLAAPARSRVAERRGDLRRLPGRPQRLRVRPAPPGRDRDRLERDPDLDRARDADDHRPPAAPAAGRALGASGSQSLRIWARP